MMRARIPTPIRIPLLRLLLAADLLLACALALLWLPAQQRQRALHWQAPAAQAAQLSDPGQRLPARTPLPVGSFLATLERPLFSPSRRPPPPVLAVAAPEVDPLDAIVLQGLYQAADGGGIFARVEGRDRRIALGSAIGPWTVHSVLGAEVTLRRGAQTRVLRLRPAQLDGAAPASAQAQTGAPAAPPPGFPAGAMPPPGAVAVDQLPPGAQLVPGQRPPGQQAQVEDPVLRQEQQRQEQERARLALRNARRAEQGFPPVKE